MTASGKVRATLLPCHPYLKGADLGSDYSFVRSLSISVFVVCVIFWQHNIIEVFIGAKRVSHYYFSGQSQTPATIYPFTKRSSKSKGLWAMKPVMLKTIKTK